MMHTIFCSSLWNHYKLQEQDDMSTAYQHMYGALAYASKGAPQVKVLPSGAPKS